MSDCLSSQLLEGFISGALSAAEKAGVEAHLADCSRCRHQLAALQTAARESTPQAGGETSPAAPAAVHPARAVLGPLLVGLLGSGLFTFVAAVATMTSLLQIGWLCLGVVCLVVGFFAGGVYMSQRERDREPVSVLVARAILPAGTGIQEEMFEVQELPRTEVPSHAPFFPEWFNLHAGRKLKNGLAAGQVLTSGDLLVDDRGKTSEQK